MTLRRLVRNFGLLLLTPVHCTAQSDATATEIAEQIAAQYQAISDFKATVLLSATIGAPSTARVKRYPGIRGYILYRKPADLRIMGTDPLAHLRMFDLVADGAGFRLSLPTRKRFLTGPNDAKGHSPNSLENIRPQHVLEVLLPKPVDPGSETISLEEPPGGGYILRMRRRTLWVDGATLHVARELILDDRRKTLTEARYSDWSAYDDVLFPKRIEIDRPQEAYKLVIQIQALEINRRLSSDMFVLEQPPGVKAETLGQTTTTR
jgi:outer membrane lipoprotein-sorting protein